MDTAVVPWIIALTSASITTSLLVRSRLSDRASRASDVRYRRLFETARDGILLLSADSGKIIDANPYIIGLTGYGKRELVGKKLWEIGVFNDITASKAEFKQLRADEYIRYEHLPIQTKAGELLDVEFVSNLYTVDGKKVIQCNVRDIIERKKNESVMRTRNRELEDINTSQEDTKLAVMNIMDDLEDQAQELKKFQMAVADSADQIIISDADGMVLYANQASEKITGYSVEEIIGTRSGSLWGIHTEKDYYEKLWGDIRKSNLPYISKQENRRKNGQAYTTEIHVSPMTDDAGKPKYFVAIERDITREKEIDKAKTEFVSLASHQLRTPLGIARWYLEAIQSDAYFKNAPKQLREYIDEIYKSNERVLSLVHDLLSISRIDQGNTENNPVPTNIKHLVKDIHKEMGVMASKKKVSLRLVMKQVQIPRLNVDPIRFHEVLENLIANALEYTPTKGKVIVTVDKENDNTALISVSDDGIGISTVTQKRLFTQFFRSEKAVSINPNGSGLGLYVVRSYVESWGGKVRLESKEGVGSTFTITIPFVVNKGSKEVLK